MSTLPDPNNPDVQPRLSSQRPWPQNLSDEELNRQIVVIACWGSGHAFDLLMAEQDRRTDKRHEVKRG